MAKSLPKLDTILSLRGRTILITGAARGMGLAIAKRCAEAGGDLVLVDIAYDELEKQANEIVITYGVQVTPHELDLVNQAAIDDFWEHLSVLPDTIVNNAGQFTGRAFIDTDAAFSRKTIQINYGAVQQMCQQFIRRRHKEGGTIVNIGSIEAKLPFKSDLALYSVSKAAVIALTRSLAHEYAHDGFKINVLLPGGVVTEGAKELAVDGLKHARLGLIADGIRFSQRLPMGRYGDPDEIARMALVLMTPLSDYMCGAEVAVDGGFLSS